MSRENVDALLSAISAKVPGFHVVIGGEDLQRARAALAGSRGLRFDLSPSGAAAPLYTSAATKAIQTAHELSAALEKQKLRDADDAQRRAAAEQAAAEHAEAIEQHIGQHPLQFSLPRLRTRLSDAAEEDSERPSQAAAQLDRSLENADGAAAAASQPESRDAGSPVREGSLPNALATPLRSANAVDGGFGASERPSRSSSPAQAAASGEPQDQAPWWALGGKAPASGAAGGASRSREVVVAILKESDKEVRVHELSLAALKYAAVEAERPDDYDVQYNYGLVLQELSTHVSNMGRRHVLLRDACDRYAGAAKLDPKSYAAPYNWAVALGDLAALLQRESPDESRECLRQASHRYAQSVELAPTNPQTLNNWGLVLQELALHLPLEHRRTVTRQAAAKFRTAIRNRPDYDRCCYNLGTVFYRFGMQLQQDHAQQTRSLQQYAVEAASQKSPDKLASHVSHREEEIREHQEEADRLLRHAATYVLLASLLQPSKGTYAQALGILRKLLPADGIFSGGLLASHRTARCESWRTDTFLLTDDSLKALPQPDEQHLASKGGYLAGRTPGASLSGEPDPTPAASSDVVSIKIADINHVLPIVDPSIPEGHAFWICLRSKPQGVYFVAQHQEDAEVWVDAITLVAHIAHSRPALNC